MTSYSRKLKAENNLLEISQVLGFLMINFLVSFDPHFLMLNN